MNNSEFSNKDERLLLAELGRFIVEFEDMLNNTRKSITHFFESEDLIDTIPIEILLHDSTSRSLADYYRSIALHHLINRVNKITDISKFEKYKKTTNKLCDHIIKAGELRNEIVHASWILSSYYGTDFRLEANRIKCTKEGLEMRILEMKPDNFNHVLNMLRSLTDFILYIPTIITSNNLEADIQIEEADWIKFNQINFESERKNLFLIDQDYYKDSFNSYMSFKKRG